MNELFITEIYKSIQGEAAYTGMPCTFIRLSGCPLRCRWCDTAYGFAEGPRMTQEEVLAQVGKHDNPLVELTGGEPLAQKAAIPLMEKLLAGGYQVLLETGGSEPIADVPTAVHIIMDIKCPGSGMAERNLWSNLSSLKKTDEVKLVIASEEDFHWAVETVKEHKLLDRCGVLFSPAFGLVKPVDLSTWILASGLPIRLNLQIHKFIWSPKARGV